VRMPVALEEVSTEAIPGSADRYRPRVSEADAAPRGGLSSPMHVCHVSWLLSPRGGGIPPVVFALAAHQRRRLASVNVLGVEDGGRGPIDPEAPSLRLHRALGPSALGWPPGMVLDLLSRQPDVVHLHGLFTGVSLAARMWKQWASGTLVVAPHGMLEPWALARSAWKKRLFLHLAERANLERARCIHALCSEEAHSIRALGLRTPIAVVPNGVDLDRVRGERDVRACSALFPHTRGRRLLLFLGRIHPKKGLLNLVRAFAAVQRELAGGDEWLLLVAGPDQIGHAAQVRALATAQGVSDQVDMVGPVLGEKKRALLAAADAFALPSYSEGFSMAVLEALAWRIPALVTRSCNFDVAQFGAGVVCDATLESITESLRSLLCATRAERRAMGDAGRRRVEAFYRWDHIAGQLESVYAWASRQGDRPRCVQEFLA